MRKFTQTIDNVPENIKVLCTVPELYDDSDFDNIQVLREAKLSFNKLTNIVYFVHAEDLLKISKYDKGHSIYLRLTIDSPYKAQSNVPYKNYKINSVIKENVSTSAKTSLESSTSSLNSPIPCKSPMEDVSLESPKFAKTSSGDLSPTRETRRKTKKNRRSQRLSKKLEYVEISCGQIEILPRLYNDMVMEMKKNTTEDFSDQLAIDNLFRRNISLLDDSYFLFYFKTESKHSIFMCQRKDEILFIKGIDETQVSGTELNAYISTEIKYKNNTFTIFAPKINSITFPIYILIDGNGYNCEQLIKNFETLIHSAIRKCREL